LNKAKKKKRNAKKKTEETGNDIGAKTDREHKVSSTNTCLAKSTRKE
jgi:hypothetical protein